jgi:hypothetical protein
MMEGEVEGKGEGEQEIKNDLINESINSQRFRRVGFEAAVGTGIVAGFRRLEIRYVPWNGH